MPPQKEAYLVARKLLLALTASVAAVLMLAGTSLAASAAPVAQSSGQGISSTQPTPLVSVAGTVSASIIPVSGVSPDNASGTSGNVTIILIGSGLHLDSWTMTSGPLSPGECTYGVFWAPANEILDLGPELCNEGDTDGTYVAYLNDVTFSANVQVCNTSVGLSGKACEEVHS